jgi:hypothetical protein
MDDQLSFLYETDELKNLFGDDFIGPDKLGHNKITLIVKYPEIKNNDGHGVEIYCKSLPAKFFKIVVLENEKEKGFALTTGSGCYREVKLIAEMINHGMIGLEHKAYESTLHELHETLGWQGGTIHQVVKEIERLKKLEIMHYSKDETENSIGEEK